MTQTIHADIDPNTGACIACGATDEHIVRGLFDACCEKPTGPNRLAIMGLRRELRLRQGQIILRRRHMASCENEIIHMQNAIREEEAQVRELDASIAKLTAEA